MMALFHVPRHLSFSFEKLILHSDNKLKVCLVNKPTIVNTFVLYTLLRYITRSATITLTIKKMKNLKCGGKVEKSQDDQHWSIQKSLLSQPMTSC